MIPEDTVTPFQARGAKGCLGYYYSGVIQAEDRRFILIATIRKGWLEGSSHSVLVPLGDIRETN